MSKKPSAGSQAPSYPPLGTLIDGNTLELFEVLGVGGYGVVYRAVEKFSSSQRSFAVKCLVSARGTRRQLHIREITLHQLASAHPSVVTLHRIVEDRDYTYIIMDYAPDDDLFTQILHKCRYLGDDTLIKHVFLQLVDAVQYCHSLGIYHRDLKPENVLCFDRGYRVAITDFGLATTEKLSKEFRTGSIYHMSPECQAGDTGKPTVYSPMHNDIWSLGIILLNLVTGRNPWKSATEDDPTYMAYRREPSRFLPSVLPISEELNSLLVQTLQISWSERLSLKKLREGVENINSFYSDDVIFEGSLARCPWEAGIDLGNEPTSESVDKRPVPNIPEGVEPYCVFSMSAVTSGFKSQASGMDEYVDMSRWDEEDARYNMRHNGIYDDDGMHTPHDTRSGRSSFSSDHSSPRTPSSPNATGYRKYDLASAYNTYDGQRYHDGKSTIYPTAGLSVEDIDDNRFVSSVFLATPVAESKQYFRHPESTHVDGYRMHKRYSSPNTSVYAVAESPLQSKFSDGSDPEILYDDDHDADVSEGFPPSSPNFVVWPEPTIAPRPGTRPTEGQSRGGQPATGKVKPRSIFNPLRFFPLSNGSSWLNPKESSLSKHPHGRSSASTRVHPAGPTSVPWMGYGHHQQPHPVANPAHYMPRGHTANTHWS